MGCNQDLVRLAAKPTSASLLWGDLDLAVFDYDWFPTLGAVGDSTVAVGLDARDAKAS